MYISYYGRPADRLGFEYWRDQIYADVNDAHVISSFGESAEYQERFGEMSSEELVNNLFQQMFNRNADPEGLHFYVERLNSGTATLSRIARQIADGAQNEDLSIFENKVSLGRAFTHFHQRSAVSFHGFGDIEFGASLIRSVGGEIQYDSVRTQILEWMESKNERIDFEEYLEQLSNHDTVFCTDEPTDSDDDEVYACIVSQFSALNPFVSSVLWDGIDSSGKSAFVLYQGDLYWIVFDDFDCRLGSQLCNYTYASYLCLDPVLADITPEYDKNIFAIECGGIVDARDRP